MTNNKTPQVVCYGEVLWDLLPSGAKPGGAPMNVAYHAGHLGASATLITRIGNDARGKQLLDVLQKMSLDTSYVQTDPEMPTGIVHAQPNEHGEMEYDIVAPAAWDFIETDFDINELVSRAEYFVCGSLVNRNRKSPE